MTTFKSVVLAVLCSWTAIPSVLIVTADDVLSQPLVMFVIGFAILAIIAVSMKVLLPSNDLKQTSKHLEKRGLLYYTCCIFMFGGMADLVIQSCHLEIVDCGTSNMAYFLNGELYLSLPFGVSVQMWNAIVHYTLQAIIIFQIDNGFDCTITTLLWCGSIVTSQFTVLVGSLSGSYSDKLEYACWLNAIFIGMPVWILLRFLNKPLRNSLPKLSSKNGTHKGFVDHLLLLSLLFSTLFCTVRALGALGSRMPIITYYVSKYEPGMTDPAQFASSWVLYTGVYLVPFYIAVMYNFNHVSQWMVNLSVFFAAGVLQGTFVYLSYSWYPFSEPKFRISDDKFVVVVALNSLLVVTTFMLMYRSLNKSGYFTSPIAVKEKRKKT